MSPPNSPLLAQEQWTISLNMAIIIDEIWKTRNLMLFQEGKANPVKARQNVQEKFLEINFFFFKKKRFFLQPSNPYHCKSQQPGLLHLKMGSKCCPK